MWEAIGKVLTSSNAAIILGFVLIILLIGTILVKKGWIQIKTSKVKIGLGEESAKLYSLFEYISVGCESYTTELLRLHPELDCVRAKYICSRVEDVFQKALVINHMSTDKTYLETKKAMVYNTILKRSDNEFFKTDEFKSSIYSFTEKMINKLIELKK